VARRDTIWLLASAEFVQHLLAAADRYDVPSLREECGRLLMRPDLITPATVAYTLTLAHQHGRAVQLDAFTTRVVSAYGFRA